MFFYLKPENLKEKYQSAEQATTGYFKDFPEYERIANAEPKNVKPGNPEVTDATTASFIETRPKAIVQKNPTGRVILNGDNDDDLEDLLTELLANEILPNAITGGNVKAKSIIAMRNMLIYGAQPALCFVRNEDDYFGADFTLVDIRDVFLEPGKTHAKDCNYIFMNAWHTEGDIDAIIANEKNSETSWNLELLKNIKNKKTTKDTDNNNAENSKTEAEFIKLVYAFQKGKKAKFYAFDPDSGEIVREFENLDPRGKIPIAYGYFSHDGKNPLGLSAIRLTRRLQDMLDMHHQNYQFQVGMKSAPITKIRGSEIDTSTIKFEPYAVWDLGTNPDADVSLVSLDDTLINTFPTVQGILKSNILNITNNGDTSISAEVGNPGFSKTPAGVTAQQQRVDVSDNYLRGQFEEWFGEVLETMLNLHISAHYKTEKDQSIPLSQKYIENKKKDSPNYENRQEIIGFEKLKGLLPKVKIDASSSKLDNDREQLETLNHLLELRIKSGAEMEQYLKIGPLVYQIVKRSGVPNAEEIAPKNTDDSNFAEQKSLTTSPSPPQAMAEETIAPQPLPRTEEKPEMQIDINLIKNLIANGLTKDNAIKTAQMIAGGQDPRQIDNFIKGEK